MIGLWPANCPVAHRVKTETVTITPIVTLLSQSGGLRPAASSDCTSRPSSSSNRACRIRSSDPRRSPIAGFPLAHGCPLQANPCGATSSTFKLTRSQPLSFLSIARLNIARSRSGAQSAALCVLPKPALSGAAAWSRAICLCSKGLWSGVSCTFIEDLHGRTPPLRWSANLTHRQHV
jgi:hypothetical protein